MESTGTEVSLPPASSTDGAWFNLIASETLAIIRDKWVTGSVVPLICLVSSICLILAQDCFNFKSKFKQADFRNRQLPDLQAAFRYRLSGLITGLFVVLFHALVLLWLYDESQNEDLVVQIRIVSLSLLSLLLYHNAKYMQRECLYGFRLVFSLAYLSRIVYVTSVIWEQSGRASPANILELAITMILLVLIIISRDIVSSKDCVSCASALSDLNSPLLPITSSQSLQTFQMGNPYDHRLLIRLSYIFVGKLITDAGSLTSVKDLPLLGREESSQYNIEEYEKEHQQGFLWGVWLFVAPVLIMSGFLELFQSCLNFMQPLFINRLLVFLELVQRESAVLEPGWDRWRTEAHTKALVSVAMLATSSCSIPIFITMYFHMQFRLAIRLRTILICLIYRKLMKLPLKARRSESHRDGENSPTAEDTPCIREVTASDAHGQDEKESETVTSPGQVVNMISSDVARVEWATMSIHNCWSALLQLILPIYLLYCQVGWPALTVILVMLVGIPLANLVFKYQLRNAKEIMKWKDKRLALTREVFSNIKCVKLFAWESELKKRVFELRERELINLWKMRVGEFLNNTIWNGLPIVMSLSVFGCSAIAVIDRNLTVQQLLTAFAILNMIAFPLSFLPLVTAAFSEGMTTMLRLKNFLSLPEMTSKNRTHTRAAQTSAYSVICDRVNFGWTRKQYVLRNVTFKFRHGIHLAIVGPTGSGKTTLIELLIGNLNPTSGHLSIHGRISYCAQSAWLQAGTIRSNILFGATMDHERYRAVCEASALMVDLAELQDGDLTRVGDRGCTLSGGQRQRIALARALYRDSDCYIFDDVLSAVDHKVARQICAEVFGKFLRNRTIILVTHRSEALEHMDYVLSLGEEQGTCTVHSANDRASLPGWFDQERESSSEAPKGARVAPSVPRLIPASPSSHIPCIEPPREDSRDLPDLGADADGHEAHADKVELHTIPWQTYLNYFESCGGVTFVLLLALMAAGSQGFAVFSNWFLSLWANSWQTMHTTRRLEALATFCLSNAAALILLAGGSLLAAFLAQRASRLIHCNLVERLLSATLAFIEGTSQGSILNRLSQDIQILDERLPQSLMSVLQETLKVAGILFVTVAALPLSLLLVLPILWIYRFLLNQFVTLSRQMQRLDASLRSPLVGIFSESVEGIATIRAFDVVPQFILTQQKRLDNHLRASYLSLLMSRWSAMRLEIMGVIITCAVGVLCVWHVNALSVSTMGLAVSYCMMLSGSLAWLVRVHGDKENNIVSVDRLTTYIECPQEEEVGNDQDDTFARDLAFHWPPAGAIHFQNVVVRYGEAGEPALQDINLKIEPGQKVAFLGRTGAGKTTLLNCLFRLTPFEGRVFIDGVDITNVPLHSLRSSLAVIPQDPITLSGTIRDNLDPFCEYSDEQIEAVLELVQLKSNIDALPCKMYTSLSDGKFEFSAGQKQLLCLARVLLRKVKVLVLDEATSSVDPVTDALMQALIRSHFKDCTVLTIAHRVSTILDYDMVVGMEIGKIVETGHPQELLKDENSLLSSLYRASQQQSSADS